jgi:hypothetical protein
MRFYREVDPKGVGAYYLELKDEIDTCIKNLSDVALSEKSDWPSLLQQIAHRMQVALSMDVNGITGIIRADLKTLGKLNSDSPEGP